MILADQMVAVAVRIVFFTGDSVGRATTTIRINSERRVRTAVA